jgi:hypothetical protein
MRIERSKSIAYHDKILPTSPACRAVACPRHTDEGRTRPRLRQGPPPQGPFRRLVLLAPVLPEEVRLGLCRYQGVPRFSLQGNPIGILLLWRSKNPEDSDPFAGTFSTCVVSVLMGREAVSVEIEQ